MMFRIRWSSFPLVGFPLIVSFEPNSGIELELNFLLQESNDHPALSSLFSPFRLALYTPGILVPSPVAFPFSVGLPRGLFYEVMHSLSSPRLLNAF